MTNEERQLLLTDLCARLPYGVMVHFEGWNPEKLSEVNLNIGVYNGMGGMPIPYLRPMLSMTDDERDEFRNVGGVMSHNVQNDTWALCAFAPEAYDWLNQHHFDYRGLIENGLALEAPEDMYKF